MNLIGYKIGMLKCIDVSIKKKIHCHQKPLISCLSLIKNKYRIFDYKLYRISLSVGKLKVSSSFTCKNQAKCKEESLVREAYFQKYM